MDHDSFVIFGDSSDGFVALSFVDYQFSAVESVVNFCILRDGACLFTCLVGNLSVTVFLTSLQKS